MPECDSHGKGSQVNRQAMRFFPLTVIDIYFPFAWSYVMPMYMLFHRMRTLHIFQIKQMTINHKLSQDIKKKRRKISRVCATAKTPTEQIFRSVPVFVVGLWLKSSEFRVGCARNKRPHVGKARKEKEFILNIYGFWLFTKKVKYTQSSQNNNKNNNNKNIISPLNDSIFDYYLLKKKIVLTCDRHWRKYHTHYEITFVL